MTTPSQPASNGGPNCWQCQHFAVSWDPARPYSCKLMGFKSRIIPALEVLRADGSPCRSFVPKPSEATATAAPAASASGPSTAPFAPTRYNPRGTLV